MRTVDRGGIHIEQCSQCRGVFLDAGELEQIVAAEERYNGAVPAYEPPGGRAPAPASAPPPRYADSPPRYADSPKPYRGGYRDSPPAYGHGQKRKRSFLESLFD
jgi:Zn-finger nucleic acid-binding protein